MHQQRKELIENEGRIRTLTQQHNETTAFLQQSLKVKDEQNELQELISS